VRERIALQLVGTVLVRPSGCSCGPSLMRKKRARLREELMPMHAGVATCTAPVVSAMQCHVSAP
jgi:hypothetical protein